MPTPIKVNKTVDERDKLKDGVKSILRLLRASMRNKYIVSYEGLAKMVWTDDQLTLLDDMRKHLGATAFTNYPITAKGAVTLEHPVLPGAVSMEPIFRIENPVATVARPFPKEFLVDNAVIPTNEALSEIFTSIIYEAMDYHCIKATMFTLANRCLTYEQALYMFPYFRMAIKRSGLTRYEDMEVKRAPASLPKIDERMRRMIKHAHTLMGMHTLMGTFDYKSNDQPPRDGDSCVVTLCGNHKFEADTGTGLSWMYRISNEEDHYVET